MIPLIISVVVIMSASLVGVVLSAGPLEPWMRRNVTLLVSFASGVFLVTSFLLLHEAFDMLSTTHALVSAVGGFILFLIIDKVIPFAHHHHDEECDHHHPRAAKILVADAFHNMADGVLLVPAFLVSTGLGVVTAVGILVHELVQEASEYLLLRDAGYTKWQALYRNALVSLTLIVGVVIAMIFVQTELVGGILVGISGGAFLHIVFHDLFPRNKESLKGSKALKHIGFFLVGVAIIGLLQFFSHEDNGQETSRVFTYVSSVLHF